MTDRFISYSINGEDIILHRIFGGREKGFYVDVGAGHPTMDNDMRALYDRGWNGINLEPSETYAAALIAERPRDTTLQVAAAEEEGELSYWEISGTGLSTCDPDEAERARQKGRTLIERRMRATTLARVLADAAVSAIDILKVDVEGLEFRVLQGNDWTRFRPSVILVEATLPETPERRPDRIRPFLEQNGYDFAYFDGLNDFFVERGFLPPPDSFRPISVFDHADRYELVNLREHAANLQSAKLVQEDYVRQLEAECAKQTNQTLLLQQKLVEAEQQTTGVPGESTAADLKAARARATELERLASRLRNEMHREQQAALARDNRARRDRAQASAALQQLELAGERLAALYRDRANAAAQAANLHAQLAHERSRMDETQADIARLRGERDEALRLLAATRASTSWRLTSPFRRAVRVLRRLAHAGEKP